MSDTLQQVQENIRAQIIRDYGTRNNLNVRDMSLMGLAEETGEVLGIAKREKRNFPNDVRYTSRDHMVEELGDVLWYLTAVCDSYGITLNEIWEENKKKLEERYG